MATSIIYHSSLALSEWESFKKIVRDNERSSALDGTTLDLGTIVAVSR